VIERGDARDSSFVAQVGYYEPVNQLLKVEVDKYESWIKKGAKPTETVVSLVKRYKKEAKKGA